MKTSSLSRALAVALLSALTFAIAGCASSKMTSTPQSEPTPQKEYQWQDMSQGKSFFGRPIGPAQPPPVTQP